jgi:hypothetical protein
MLEGLLDVWRVRRPGQPQDDEPDPVRSELRGELRHSPSTAPPATPAAVAGTGVGATVMDMVTRPLAGPSAARGEELGPVALMTGCAKSSADMRANQRHQPMPDLTASQ